VVPPPLEQPAIDAAGDPAEPDAPPTAAGDQTASDATELEAASPPGAPTAAGDPAEPEGQPETAGDQTGSGKDDGQAGETGETEVTP
jgi:hypothetical protein